MNILNDINTLLCPSKNNSNSIELTVQTSCYWGLRLTLGYNQTSICLLFVLFVFISLCGKKTKAHSEAEN